MKYYPNIIKAYWYKAMKPFVKYILLLSLPILLMACGPSSDDVSKQVLASMQEKFDTDANLKQFHLTAKSAQFVKQEGNQFKGIVKVQSKDGIHDISVTATADGKNVVWEAPSDAFSFLAIEQLNQSLQQLQNLFQGMIK
jgi:hypothetical protein